MIFVSASSENVYVGMLSAGLASAHSIEVASIFHLERLLEELEEYPQEQDRIDRHLAETRQQLVRVEGFLQMVGAAAGQDASLELLAAAKKACGGTLLPMAFALASLKAFEMSIYRFLILVCEPAGFQHMREGLEISLAQEKLMADWININFTSLAVHHLQGVKAIPGYPVLFIEMTHHEI